ncbi:MAG: hypothetical protein V3S55_06375 [Nitrospiraceae bacterium]
MPLTNFPSGVSSFGMPVLGSGGLMTTGDVFFVDSGAAAAADGNAMTDPAQPGATIDAAIGRCAADNGDIIIVMPGHTENLTASIAMDVAGISVFGLGNGHTRPLLSYTGTGGVVTFSASNVRWSNIVHDCSIAAVTNAILASGTIQRVEIDHCHFTFDATGVEFTVMIALGGGATDSADYVFIHDNWFEAENIDGCASALLIDDCQFVHIRNNLFTGDFNSVAIDGAAGSSACLDYVIADNYIENRDTGFTIDLDDSATGVAYNNMVAGGGASGSNVDWGNLRVCENYVTEAADVTGIVVPITAQS